MPSHVIPLYHPPTVVTIHDLGYIHRPESHPASQRRMLDITTLWSARVARHIIVPSDQTANDLQNFYKVPSNTISVVHHGIDPRMSSAPNAVLDTEVRELYGLSRPFVLAVGTVQPRKNLGVLARAVNLVRKHHDIDLVIAGRKGWMFDEVQAELDRSGLGAHLRHLDYVPSEHLPSLYREATVFAQPSKFEGFGMPVLEAMASGTPVAAASGSSLEEIGGNAAVVFDPDDEQELSSHILRLLNDDQARNEMVCLGLSHASAFTWEQTAIKTRIILEEHLLN